MTGKRILEFDALRSLAVIWIITIWHFVNYFKAGSFLGEITNNELCRNVTYVMLSLFMFLSGLFTNTKFEKIDDVKGFYLKKIKRFYPLYVLATLTLYVTPTPHDMSFYTSLDQLIMSLFGVATLLNHAPSTLWFMDMLLFFIMITPVLTWKNNKVREMIMMSAIFVLIYVESRKMHVIDSRFLRYSPFYFGGLLMTPNGFLELCKKHGLKCILLALFIILIGKHHVLVDIVMYALFISGGGR